MLKSLRDIIYSEKVVLTLFSLLIASFPFGAHLMSFSLGFMTIYPYLLILCVMVLMGFFHSDRIKGKVQLTYLFFIFGLALVGVCFLPFVEDIKNARIDLRNMSLFLGTAYVLLWTKEFLGFEKWRYRLLGLLKIIYVLIVIFSLFELKTGIHFAGYFTDEIVRNSITQNIYVPIFLYDNPNNLAVYVFLIGLCILILDGFKNKSYLLAIIILITNYLVARMCHSRFGELAALVWLLWILANLFNDKLKELKRKKLNKDFYILWISVIFGLAIITFVSNPKYYAPIWSSEQDAIIENMDIIENLPDSASKKEFEKANVTDQALIENHLVTPKMHQYLLQTYGSGKIRYALLNNGLDYIGQTKGIGIGPGQFRYKHYMNQKKYYTRTNINPHFWLLELGTQFGVIPLLLYLAGLSALLFLAISNLKKNFYLISLLAFSIPIFIVISFLPSSFLSFDIHWIFTSVLVIGFSVVLNRDYKIDTDGE